MYPPFPSENTFLQIYNNKYHAGKNPVNLRDTYYPGSQSTITSVFTMPNGTAVNGIFYSDAGDTAMTPLEREPRYFGAKFKVTQVVSGQMIIVRVQVNSGWTGAAVYIDGQVPSTIPGVVGAVDIVSSDAAVHGYTGGTKYLDIPVAGNLANVPHTVELYANGTLEFVYVGMKGRSFKVEPQTFDMRRVRQTTAGNSATITFANLGKYPVQNVQLTVSPNMTQADSRKFPLNQWTIGTIAPNFESPFTFTVDGVNQGNSADCNVTLYAEYRDLNGPIVRNEITTLEANSAGLAFQANGWLWDNLTPNGSLRVFNSQNAASVTFECNAPTISITVQKEAGFGTLALYRAGVQQSIVDLNDPNGGGQLIDVAMATGITDPTVMTTLTIVASTALTPSPFTKIRWVSNIGYSAVTEVIPMVARFNEVPPFTPNNINIVNGKVTYAAPNLALEDLTLPRTNKELTSFRTYARMPTFAVYYSNGYEELLSDYDLLVVEPSAVSYRQVAAWQAKGIKVFGYVSFGEEDSERVPPLDLTSTVVGPHIDDGLGPGGYASYYNKAGNEFGESSECGHDNQRLLGAKTCALANPNYLAGVGRCSPACQWDSRGGGAIHNAGGACGKGYTRLNNWIRDPMTACKNSACPQYAPLNKGCAQYTRGSVIWGQDFSVATPNYPDQNGIWGSTFINPTIPTWKAKLQNKYLKTVFGMPTLVTQVLTMQSVNATTLGVQLTDAPFDTAEPFTVTMANGASTFTFNTATDLSFDATTGVFNWPVQAAGYAPVAPTDTPVYGVGTSVTITYYRKGLNCDGVFMDTVDTVDVYPSAAFQNAMATMINDLKALHPTKLFCSNRGFTILDKVINSCSHVMFESFLSDYNWNTDTYSLITEPTTVAWNDGIKMMLRNLRKDHVFDVLALNYCHNGTAGDAMRDVIYETCYREGYMCWTSTILLNNPEAQRVLRTNRGGRIQTTGWTPIKDDVTVSKP